MKHVLTAAAIAVAASAASVQYHNHFRGYAASPQGVPLTGQDGWTSGPLQPSRDLEVYVSRDNELRFPPRPDPLLAPGNGRFIAGSSDGATPARAQHAVGFFQPLFYVSTMIAVKYDGVNPPTPVLGSFSLEHSTLGPGQFRSFATDYRLVDPLQPLAGWEVALDVFTATGAPRSWVPGPEFSSLEFNHWYTLRVAVTLHDNRVKSLRLKDFVTHERWFAGSRTTYLTGGVTPPPALADAFRLTVDGPAGSAAAWGFLSVGLPAPGATSCLALGALYATRRRRAGT
jgi:hypothetical protein